MTNVPPPHVKHISDLPPLGAMEPGPFLLVVASAFSHATWNVLAKKGEDKEAYMWIMVTTSLVTLIPVYVIILPDWSFPLAALPYMLVSAVAEVLYFISLGRPMNWATSPSSTPSPAPPPCSSRSSPCYS